MAGKPTPLFYVATMAIVAGLIGFAAYRATRPADNGGGNAVADSGSNSTDSSTDLDIDQMATAESPDAVGITTVNEYEFKPSERLPEVKGTAAYKPMEDNTVRFALNVWAGWAPIIQANNGFKAGKVWKTPDGQEFKVELVLIDDPVAMRDAYTSGEVHIGWCTLDMMPLLMEGFVGRNGDPIDSRVMPRIFQQVDWSNGGDGIVARGGISSIGDLRGKKIVLAENSPSQYFIMNMLVYGGVQPSEVEFVYTGDAFQAAAAFNSQKDIDAVVSWAPDIYTLSEVKGNKMIVSTGTANKLIADVWFARADFAKDHSEICEGIVRGIFDAMQALNTDAGKQNVAKLMADGYGLPASDALGMLADAHSTNWAENYQFFLNKNNPANFERVWNQAYYIYRRLGKVTHPTVKFDKVMDFSIIEKLGKEEEYANQVDEYTVPFIKTTTSQVRGAEEILTNTVVIHFFPNSAELYKMVTKNENGKDVESLYDPKVDFVLEEIAKLAGQFGTARIVIEGHTDSSMKGRAPASLVKELSQMRADAVKDSLVKKFELDPNQFNTDGIGWDRPADLDDPMNHALNRRVEVKIYPAEAIE
ncbi:Taurine-binding periplasmic protein precursor [Novipirellula aureliae]|uniref:Taurine-binding periplasmic protein n=1 Tax=Novipirellula aureliae TaxID=2527966 RepID=A0A5C6EC67_9BACT|nr:phosphate ABC transporter substrate-binding/OmpA family protein [Novipirellula aureliae]TWU46034.1 Taurine-binding periplasmic protein precursor [Novipirellula aureliae]